MTNSYRGKYPLHINSVGIHNGVASVTTRDGTRAIFHARNIAGELPNLGQPLLHWQAVNTYGEVVQALRDAYGKESAEYRWHAENHSDHAHAATGKAFDLDATTHAIARVQGLLAAHAAGGSMANPFEREAMEARDAAPVAPKPFDPMTATPREVIARSISMHPSLFAECMEAAAKVHFNYARVTDNKRVAVIAEGCGNACKLVARYIREEDPCEIMKAIRFYVPALNEAFKLQCIPRSLWADITAREAA